MLVLTVQVAAVVVDVDETFCLALWVSVDDYEKRTMREVSGRIGNRLLLGHQITRPEVRVGHEVRERQLDVRAVLFSHFDH